MRRLVWDVMDMYLHWGVDDQVREVGKEKDPRTLNESSK